VHEATIPGCVGPGVALELVAVDAIELELETVDVAVPLGLTQTGLNSREPLSRPVKSPASQSVPSQVFQASNCARVIL
jgi:hypothetical protein